MAFRLLKNIENTPFISLMEKACHTPNPPPLPPRPNVLRLGRDERSQLGAFEVHDQEVFEAIKLDARETGDCSPEAKAGAEDDISDPTPNVDDATSVDIEGENEAQDIHTEAALYMCETVHCLWPCRHHGHRERKRDFVWVASDALDDRGDCSYCSLFVEIGKKYCGCHSNAKSGWSAVSHPCECVFVEYDGDVCSLVTLASTCGAVELELGISSSITGGQGIACRMLDCSSY